MSRIYRAHAGAFLSAVVSLSVRHFLGAREAEAKRRGVPFRRFNLQHCRPKVVSDKLAPGDADTRDATGHVTDKMIAQIYDRRWIKKATPAG